MKKFLPHPIFSLVLLVAWLLLNNSFTVGQILLGSLFGWLLPLWTQKFCESDFAMKKPKVLVKFMTLVLWDILVSNFLVAKQVLGKTSKLEPTFYRVPLDIKSDIGISWLANTISLTPGTVTCDVSLDKTFLEIHSLHTQDIAGDIAEIKQRYEAPLIEVFESA